MRAVTAWSICSGMVSWCIVSEANAGDDETLRAALPFVAERAGQVAQRPVEEYPHRPLRPIQNKPDLAGSQLVDEPENDDLAPIGGQSGERWSSQSPCRFGSGPVGLTKQGSLTRPRYSQR